MSANYEQPEYIEKRLRYFDGQFLKDQDFIDEQKYHIDRQRRGDRLLQVSGIGEGLKVTAQGVATALLEPGTAIDSKGRLVVLAEEQNIDLAEYKNKAPNLVISYQEKESDPSQEGSEGNRRWDEQPEIDLVSDTDDLPTDAIVLAKLNVDKDGIVTVDTSVRQYSGIYLPSGDTPSGTKQGPTLRSGGDSHSNLAVLTGDLSVTGNLNANGNLSTAGDLSVTGNLSANGNVGIGTNNPTKKLEVHGTIKSQGLEIGNTTIGETDLQNLQSHIIIVGMILMWSGAIDNIPSGWALCNGENGTPDLRDRFIVAAGNVYSVKQTGGSNSHTHTVSVTVEGHALTINEIPSHYHNISDLNRQGNPDGWGDGGRHYWRNASYSANRTSDQGKYTDSQGGNQAHSHDANITMNSSNQEPLYYSLAFIIKL